MTNWERRPEALVPGTEGMTRAECAANCALLCTTAWAWAHNDRAEGMVERYVKMERMRRARWGLEWREVAEQCEAEVAAWVIEQRLEGEKMSGQVAMGLLKRS